MLADCAVLVHVWDDWEDHTAPWRANGDQSCSIIHAGQHAPGRLGQLIPLYNPNGAGLVFRPQATPIKCGKGGDSGGHCDSDPQSQNWCPSVNPTEQVTASSVASYDYPGDGWCVQIRTYLAHDSSAFS